MGRTNGALRDGWRVQKHAWHLAFLLILLSFFFFTRLSLSHTHTHAHTNNSFHAGLLRVK